MHDLYDLIERLELTHSLSLPEYEALISGRDKTLAAVLRERAVNVRKAVYENTVYTRGLIEISSWCKNDCLYCGIRHSNKRAERYRLPPDEILSCCREGWELGFRTFVLQGGEDPWFTDEVLSSLLRQIKTEFPDCAVTLSLGERSRTSYQRLYDAGADRYLLRHETADKTHYETLHPPAAASPGTLPGPSDGMSTNIERNRLPGWLRLHGRLARADGAGAGKGFEVRRDLSS